MDRGHEVHAAAPSVTNKRVGMFTEEHNGHDMIVHRIHSWRWYPQPWLRFALPWRIKQNARRIVDAVKPDVIHFQSHIVTGRGFSIAAVERGIELVGTNHFMPENLLEYTLIPKFFQKKAIRMAWDAAARSYGRANAVTSPHPQGGGLPRGEHRHPARLRDLERREHARVHAGLEPEVGEPRSSSWVGWYTRSRSTSCCGRSRSWTRAGRHASRSSASAIRRTGAEESREVARASLTASTFAGSSSDDEKKDALHRAKVFAMPSIAELQSISTMEAMASGLPVVAAQRRGAAASGARRRERLPVRAGQRG